MLIDLIQLEKHIDERFTAYNPNSNVNDLDKTCRQMYKNAHQRHLFRIRFKNHYFLHPRFYKFHRVLSKRPAAELGLALAGFLHEPAAKLSVAGGGRCSVLYVRGHVPPF